MGYLTTFTIYNDGASELKKHPKKLADTLYTACSGDMDYRWAGLGSHANLITVQKPRHADEHTLYLHAGNTVTDVYEAKSEWAINAFIAEMTYQLKRLNKLRNEIRESK